MKEIEEELKTRNLENKIVDLNKHKDSFENLLKDETSDCSILNSDENDDQLELRFQNNLTLLRIYKQSLIRCLVEIKNLNRFHLPNFNTSVF